MNCGPNITLRPSAHPTATYVILNSIPSLSHAPVEETRCSQTAVAARSLPGRKLSSTTRLLAMAPCSMSFRPGKMQEDSEAYMSRSKLFSLVMVCDRSKHNCSGAGWWRGRRRWRRGRRRWGRRSWSWPAGSGAGPSGGANSGGSSAPSGPNVGQNNNSATTGSGINSQSPGARRMATDPTGQPYNPRNLNDPNNPANPNRPAR